MSVEFEDAEIKTPGDQVLSYRIIGSPEHPKMVSDLVKLKIVKSEKTAYRVLLMFSILAFVGVVGAVVYFVNPFGLRKAKYDLPADIVEKLPTRAQKVINN
jgi:hypothetical protein